MSRDISTTNLQINILSKKQYDEASPNDGELYFVEDERNVWLLDVTDIVPTNATNGDRYYSPTDKKIYTYNDGWGEPSTPDMDVLYASKDSKYSYVWDGTDLISIGGFSGYDNQTITLNNDEKIQANGVINQNNKSIKYDWMGTRAEYDALGTYNDNWVYYITDDEPSENMSLSNVLNRLNKASAWLDGDTIVYTIPLPEVGYNVYSDVDMTILGQVSHCSDTQIVCNNITYTKNEQFDNVFNGISDDSQKQIITLYDLIKAFKGI